MRLTNCFINSWAISFGRDIFFHKITHQCNSLFYIISNHTLLYIVREKGREFYLVCEEIIFERNKLSTWEIEFLFDILENSLSNLLLLERVTLYPFVWIRDNRHGNIFFFIILLLNDVSCMYVWIFFSSVFTPRIYNLVWDRTCVLTFQVGCI